MVISFEVVLGTNCVAAGPAGSSSLVGLYIPRPTDNRPGEIGTEPVIGLVERFSDRRTRPVTYRLLPYPLPNSTEIDAPVADGQRAVIRIGATLALEPEWLPS